MDKPNYVLLNNYKEPNYYVEFYSNKTSSDPCSIVIKSDLQGLKNSIGYTNSFQNLKTVCILKIRWK